MVTIREISIAIYGTWRFATLDRAAVQFFDNTPDAFWKSFNAAWLALPAYALLVLLSLHNTRSTPEHSASRPSR